MEPTKLFSLLVFLLVLLAPAGAAHAQQITGTVTDSLSGEPLPGVNVVVEGTTTGTATDGEGGYSLSVPSLQDTLVFSFVGYEAKEVPIDGRTQIDVALEPTTLVGEELVVVGYGTQSRETISSSVTSVDSESFENITVGDAATILQGSVSGLRVQQTDGQPGSAPQVVMRGGASILNPDGAEPLYIVDGITRPNLSGINSEDIESMQVLKDASATAIYGARAANGVVVVTTKGGEVGQTQFDYSYSVNFSQQREGFPTLNGEEHIWYTRIGEARRQIGSSEGRWNNLTLEELQAWFAENPDFMSESGSASTGNDLTDETSFTPQYLSPENEHLLGQGWQTMQDPLDPSKTIIFKDTDWQDVMFRTGVTHDHHINASGGSENARFNVGIGYTAIDGITIHTNYERISGNLRGTLQVLDNLSVSSNVIFSRESDNEVFSNNAMFERSISFAPTAKRTFQDGSPAHYRVSPGNPEYYLPKFEQDNQINTYSLSAQASWEILPGLSFEPSANLYSRQGEEHSFQRAYMNAGSLVSNRNTTGLFTNYDQQEYDALLNFNREISDAHNFDGVIGASYYDRSSRNISAQGTGAATDEIRTLNAAATAESVSSSINERRIIGFFGRLNYDYNLRYLLTFTSRYDGASNLGAANKWAFFPAISAGWNIHNEEFWTNPLYMTRLKLRASYGESGNLGTLGDYTAQGSYNVGDAYLNEPAIEYDEIANAELRWEQSRTLNLGLELGFLEDRVQYQIEGYRRVTDDLIMSLTLPASSGFSNLLTNLGSLENKGLEMELRANLFQGSDWGWDVSLNASRNTNKILKLPENDNENNRIGGFYVWDDDLGDYTWKGGLQEGGTMGEMYAYLQTGVYSTDEAAADGPLNTMRLTGVQENYGGDAAFYDADGDGLITPRDRRYMGNIYPDWTGGVSSRLSYKNWSVFVRGDYATGHTIFNYVRTSLNGSYAAALNPTSDIRRSWMEPGDQTDVPAFYTAEQIGRGNTWMGDSRGAVSNGTGSSYYFEKGDFFAVREVSVIYNAPNSWSEAIGLRNLRINVTAENVHYFTGYFGLSPEEGGMDRGRYPLPRNFSLSVQASL